MNTINILREISLGNFVTVKLDSNLHTICMQYGRFHIVAEDQSDSKMFDSFSSLLNYLNCTVHDLKIVALHNPWDYPSDGDQ